MNDGIYPRFRPAAIVMALFCLGLLYCRAEEPSSFVKWEYKAVSTIGVEKVLADLAAAGWEYVGPAGVNIVIFKRPVPTPGQQAAKAELAKLQGTWKLTFWEYKGKELKKEGQERFLIIDGDSWIEKTVADKKIMRAAAGTIAIWPFTETPKLVDVFWTDGRRVGLVSRGIFQLEGDTLKYCVSETGSGRPTEFKTKEDDLSTSFLIYQRQKP